MRESIVAFGRESNLVGIWTEPDTRPGSDVALLCLNSRELHRVGPHRLFVELARRAATAGLSTLRFDYRSMGYSPDAERSLEQSQEEKERIALEDTRDALTLLRKNYGVQRVVMMGNCAGAYVGLKMAADDERVMGIAALNTPIELCTADSTIVTALESERRGAQLGRGSLRDPERWRRLFTGKTSWRRIAAAVTSRLTPRAAILPTPAGPSDARDLLTLLRHLKRRGQHASLVFCQDELAHRYLRQTYGDDTLATLAPEVQFWSLPGVDHLLIQRSSFEAFTDDVTRWMVGIATGVVETGCPYRDGVDGLSPAT